MSVYHDRMTHLFNNGIRVYDDHLTPGQRERYLSCNLHEPEEERIFVELISSLPACGCFLNIGCAVGYYLILAHRIRPDLQLYAVEPFEEHQRYLRENLSLNEVDNHRVTLFTFAISDRTGTASFLEKDYGSSLLPPDTEISPRVKGRSRRLLQAVASIFRKDSIAENAQPDRSVTEVETRKLHQLLDRIDGEVHLLQMDIQGSESRVLRAGLNSLKSGRINTLLIGTHSEQIHRECVQILKSAGYRIEFSEVAVEQQPDGMILAKYDAERAA